MAGNIRKFHEISGLSVEMRLPGLDFSLM